MTSIETDYLYRRWVKYLIVVAHGILGDWSLSQDAVQDCFVKVFKKEIMPVNPEEQRKLLKTIVRNDCLDKLKSGKKMQLEPVECLLSDEYINERIDLELCGEIIDRLIEKHLHPRDKIVIRLYLDGMTRDEIAKKLGKSVSTITNQRASALSVLVREVKKINNPLNNI